VSRNIRVLGLCILAVVAVSAFSAVASASASAAVTCYKVAVPKTGTFSNEECTEAGGTKEYINAELATRIKASEWCAKVAKPTGKYSNNACTEEKTGATEKEYIKVLLPCYKVAEPGKGNLDSSCNIDTGTTKNEYVEVLKLETQLRSGEWCAKVEVAGSGTFEKNTCTGAAGTKEYIKVLVPEFEHCIKTTAKTDEYPTKEACVKNEKKGEEPREWDRVSVATGSKIKFTDIEKESHLYGPKKVIVTCKEDTSTGEITGATTTAGDTVTFTGCTAKEGEKVGCSAKSTGQPAGTIKTEGLRDTLGTVAKAEATSEVGEALEPEGTKGFVTIEAECLELKTTQVSGSVIGEVKPINAMEPTGELNFECNPAKSTTQKIQRFVGFPKDTLSAFTNASCFESFPDKITFAEPIEVAYP
jgi:hypothetical protein